MKRHVQVRPDPALEQVRCIWLNPPDPFKPEEVEPDLKCTRIWMGAVPPEGRSPGYACIVGEVYDDDPMQRDRLRIVLDEAIALDPEDFDEDERTRFQIHPNSMAYPTLYSLYRAIVALKDLWAPDMFRVPLEEPKFIERLQAVEGLTQYHIEQEHNFARWFPFYRSQHHTLGVPTFRGWPPEFIPKEDREHSDQVVSNLLAQDLLMVHGDCSMLDQRQQWTTVRRCLGYVLVCMQDMDLTFEIRAMRPKERGYLDAEAATSQEAAEAYREQDREIEGIAWMMGYHVNDPLASGEDDEL